MSRIDKISRLSSLWLEQLLEAEQRGRGVDQKDEKDSTSQSGRVSLRASSILSSKPTARS